MQKKFTLFAFALACIGIYDGCKKPPASNTEFEVVGVKNISLGENGSDEMSLSIKQISGTSELVTLSLEGLPEGVSASFNPGTAQPEFESSVYLKDDSSAGGTYDITLKAHAAKGREKKYPFKLVTLDKTCATRVAGTYHGTSYVRTGQGTVHNNFEFSEDSSDKNILHFRWNNHDAYLILNCNKNKVIVPYQDVGKYKITGEGYYEANYKVVDFDFLERHDNGDTISGTAYFTR